MPNANYIAGRDLEYKVMKDWNEKGYDCVRAAGSHGKFDVVAFRHDRKPEFIQCKRVIEKSEAKRLMTEFRSLHVPSTFYHQVMAVKIKGSSEILSTTV